MTAVLPLNILIPLLLILLLLLAGVPVLFSLAIGNLLLIQTTDIFQLLFFSNSLYSGLNSLALIAIPLFILTGDAIVESGTAEKLIDFADRIVGGFQTGVGSSTILGCGLFASISGSNAADAAAIGRISYSSLKQYGYPGPYASALIASGATTGILIPPSIAYIIIGVTIGVPVGTLFLASVIPGVLVLSAILLTNVVINHSNNYEQGHEFANLSEIARATWDAKEALSIPVIILGGIYSGIFTPTESAAVAVAVVAAIGIVRGTLHLNDFWDLFERSAIINGTIAPLIAVALSFSQSLNALGLPSIIVSVFESIPGGFYATLLLMLAIFLVAGAILETTPNILLLAPLLYPVSQNIGMAPVHFAVFMNTALGIGFITPPFGMNLYVMSSVTSESIAPISKRSVPFLLILILLSILIGIFPSLSTVLVQ